MHSVSRRITRLSTTILIVLAVLVCGAPFAIRYRTSHARYVHERNVAKIEEIRKEFDKQVQHGSTLSAVEQYLRTTPYAVSPVYKFADGREYVRTLRVSVAEEPSEVWFCGKWWVGLELDFTPAELLQSSSVRSWTNNCP